jgi:hypothetical protein
MHAEAPRRQTYVWRGSLEDGMRLTDPILMAMVRSARADPSFAVGNAHAGVADRDQYNTDFYKSFTIQRILQQFQAFLSELAADPDWRISKMPLLRVPPRLLLKYPFRFSGRFRSC